MSLCFDEAYTALKSQRISEEEYLHQVLAHFCGIRHPADEIARRPWELMVRDPVGNAIREAALAAPHITKPDSMSQLEKLFASALQDDADAVRTHLTQSTSQHVPVQTIATFAALHSDAEVLRLCLQMGASLEDRNTSIAIEFAARGPALLDVLYEYDWQDMRTSALQFNRLLEWSLHTSPEELNWFLDHGAKVDREKIRRSVHGGPLRAPCVGTLIRRFGVELFKGTKLLQSAAKRGRNDVVKVLLDAGLDADELVPRNEARDDGECELTALYEAVYKQHEDTVKLLLDYGADPDKRVCECECGLDTPLKLAQGHGYTKIVALMHPGSQKNQHTDGRSYVSKL